MDTQKRTQLVLGVLLVLIGALFLAWRLFGWNFLVPFTWPMIIVVVGAGLLLLGLLVGAPDMAVPACIVAGIGGILYYQDTTNDWVSWSYMWALIPAFVGVGVILAALIGGRPAKHYMDGLGSIAVGLVLFVIFGSVFGRFEGNMALLAPIVLIVVGLFVLVRNFIRPAKQ